MRSRNPYFRLHKRHQTSRILMIPIFLVAFLPAGLKPLSKPIAPHVLVKAQKLHNAMLRR